MLRAVTTSIRSLPRRTQFGSVPGVSDVGDDALVQRRAAESVDLHIEALRLQRRDGQLCRLLGGRYGSRQRENSACRSGNSGQDQKCCAHDRASLRVRVGPGGLHAVRRDTLERGSKQFRKSFSDDVERPGRGGSAGSFGQCAMQVREAAPHVWRDRRRPSSTRRTDPRHAARRPPGRGRSSSSRSRPGWSRRRCRRSSSPRGPRT